MKAERRAGERAATPMAAERARESQELRSWSSLGLKSSSSTNWDARADGARSSLLGHHNDFASTRDHNAARLVRAPLSDDVRARQRPTIYPVKSCSGVHVDAAVLTETGLRFDRAWMVVEDRPKKPASARRGRRRAKTPRVHVPLAARRAPPRACHRHPPPEVLDPSWDGLHLPSGAALVISAPTMHRYLTIPLEAPAASAPPRRRVGWTGDGGDEGDDAAAWFTEYLGRPARLARSLGAGGLPPAAADPARGTRGAAPGSRRVATAAALAGLNATHRAVDARFRFASRGDGRVFSPRRS